MQRECAEVGGRLVEYSYEKGPIGVRKVTWSVYKKPNGHLFSVPVDDAETGSSVRSSITRTATTEYGDDDKYIVKGFKHATLKDRLEALAKAEMGEKVNEEVARTRNPMEVAKAAAKLQGEAFASALRDDRSSKKAG